MMNNSKIDWCDFSWNPVTGCYHTCEYCYARRMARRFSGDIRLNMSSGRIKRWSPDSPEGTNDNVLYVLPKPFTTPFPVGFAPMLHEYRLSMPAQMKKPANIFVCSMADLFGEWVPDEWIERVFEACKAAPQHNYLFLTKNPSRYLCLAESGKLPKQENFWYGTTATKPESMVFYAAGYNTFVSIEPIEVDFGEGSYHGASWIIVGAETGNRSGKITPQREWIEGIVEVARSTGIPVLLKDSGEMREVWGDDLIQEFPESLKHPADAVIPHCKECEHCTREPQGNRGEKCLCEIGWEPTYDDRGARHVPGRYSRTSPPWCPKRRKEE